MKKYIIFALLITSVSAHAQKDTVGVSRFTAIYLYECKTADADGQPVTDSMYIVVQTSDGITKSCPYEEYDRQKKGGSRIADSYQAARMHMGTVFTNYPEGRITTQEMLYPYRYMTDEPLEKQNWTLTDGQDSICGYACMSASAKYHGNTWNVYYTEEVRKFNIELQFRNAKRVLLRKDFVNLHLLVESALMFLY